MCLLCAQFSEAERTNVLMDALRDEHEEHVARKTEARAEKEKDKNLVKENSAIEAMTFDLEFVLPTPCNQVSQTHFKS